MPGKSCIDEAGHGTGATMVRKASTGRDKEAFENESSTASACADTTTSNRRSSTKSTAAAATAVEQGDRRRKEGGRGEKSKGSAKAKSGRRSRSERSSPKPAAVPVALEGEGEASTLLLASPSTKEGGDTNSSRSSMTKTDEDGEKEKKERRRRSSSKTGASSNISSSTTFVRKPSNDASSHRHRTRSSSSHSPYYVVEAQQQAQEPTVAHTAHVPPSAPDSKRRKRTHSSRTLPVDNKDGDPAELERAPPIMQQSTIHSGRTTASRALCCPNATSSTTGKKCHGARLNSGAVRSVPSHDFPAAVETPTAEPEPATEYNERPIEVVGQRKKSIIGTEPSSSGGEGNGKEPGEGCHSGRQSGSTRWRGHEVTQENILRRGKIELTEGEVSRRHNSDSSSGERTRGKRTARAATGAAVDPSPPQAFGVEVIDEGATKQLVLCADETTAGRGKPRSSGERSRGVTKTCMGAGGGTGRRRPAQPFDTVHSQHEENKLLHRRDQLPLNAKEEGRNRSVRETFAKAVLAEGGDGVADSSISTTKTKHLTDALVQGVEDNETTTTRGNNQQRTPAGRSPPLGAANNKHPESTHHNHPDEHPFENSRKEKVSATDAACISSPTDGQRIAPSFSIIQTNDRNSINPSPLTNSTSSSSFLGRPDHERTAKYVPEQASFHADISNDYVDLDSPLGELEGEGEEEEVGNGDRPRVASNFGLGVTTSSPPVESFSCNTRSVSVTEDSRPEKSHEQENDPALSLRQAPKTFGISSHNGREDDRPEVPTNTSQRTRAFLDPQITTGHECALRPAVGCETELDVSSSTPTTVPVANPPAGAGRNARLDPDQQQHFERGFTPSLSQVQPESAGRSKESVDRNVENGGELAGDLVHFRTDASRHLVCGERPALFFLRPNESLAVTRIKGAGRLLVTLREEAGAAAVVVIDGATVHDSAAHFGHAAIQVG